MNYCLVFVYESIATSCNRISYFFCAGEVHIIATQMGPSANLTELPTLPERVHLTVLVYGEEDTNPWIQEFATSDGQGRFNIYFLIFIVFSYMASNEYLPTYVFPLASPELT